MIHGDDSEAVEKLRTSETKPKLIGTHSEMFHCDEVMATTMLLYTKEYANAAIVRTRND